MERDAPLVRRLNRAILGLADRIVSPRNPVRRALSPLYSSLLGAVGRGQGYPAEINGQIFRIDPAFRWTFWHGYERPVAEFLAASVKPGQCCFDIGANIGVYVLQMSRWSAPDGRIVAFEANPATVKVLRTHVALNGLDSRVTIVPVAAGASRGTARLFGEAAGSGLSRIDAPHRGIEVPVQPTEVPMITIDDYCRETGAVPHWMIVDVEGYEYEVLQGAAETIRRHRPRILVEMHEDVPEGSRERGARLFDELGIRAVPIEGGGGAGRTEEFVSLEYAPAATSRP